MWKQEREEQEGRIRQSSSTKKRQSPQVITQQKQILSASCVGVGPLFDMTQKIVKEEKIQLPVHACRLWMYPSGMNDTFNLTFCHLRCNHLTVLQVLHS